MLKLSRAENAENENYSVDLAIWTGPPNNIHFSEKYEFEDLAKDHPDKKDVFREAPYSRKMVGAQRCQKRPRMGIQGRGV